LPALRRIEQPHRRHIEASGGQLIDHVFELDHEEIAFRPQIAANSLHHRRTEAGQLAILVAIAKRRRIVEHSHPERHRLGRICACQQCQQQKNSEDDIAMAKAHFDITDKKQKTGSNIISKHQTGARPVLK